MRESAVLSLTGQIPQPKVEEKKPEPEQPKPKPRIVRRDKMTGSYYERVKDFETKLILDALSVTQDNISQAANFLGLQRTTLTEKMKKLGLKPTKQTKFG
jgi:DNA-binding NtrC family response regulator